MKSIEGVKFFQRITAAVLLLVPLILLQAGAAGATLPEPGAQVASLGLGMQGYVIGTRLSRTQKESAAANLSRDSYAGTYKFLAGDIFIVASENDDTILAIYKRIEEADMDEVKLMISGLMGLYGEPTTMAHDKMIYWAYTAAGKIPEETYRKIKDSSQAVDILATVKFNSSFKITGENPAPEKTGTIYFIITSDSLVREFISQDN
jgi:hypothetical protein